VLVVITNAKFFRRFKTMVSFDTSLNSWKGKAMLALPLIAGGVLGEYLDQKGLDEKVLAMNPIKLGAPFDKVVPIVVLAVLTFILFSTKDMTSARFTAMSLGAGAMMGILVNYSAKLILGGKTAGGAV
jgi:hypothetical protein